MTLARLLVGTFAVIVAPLAAAPITPEPPTDRPPSMTASVCTSGAPMTLDCLDALIRQVDVSANRDGPGWQLTVDGTVVQVIADADHDRMRIVVPVRKESDVSDAMLRRCMQANFATALDARYAVAQGVLWTAFLHPLGSLDEALLLSGLGQTVMLARSYGTTFRSGELSFRGGDLPEERPPTGTGQEPEL